MSSNGKQGEQLFQQKMQQLGHQVQNVSANPEYWTKDIDFIVTSSATGLTKSFEVKWDSKINKTHNLYLELTNVHSKGGNGWFKFCEADYLAYGDAKKRLFYIIPLDQLKERVKHLPQKMAQCGADSIGLLVSLADIADIADIAQQL